LSSASPGKKHWLWRAVDQDGFVLDVLVQSRRDKKAAKRLFRKWRATVSRPVSPSLPAMRRARCSWNALRSSETPAHVGTGTVSGR
jgi:transposase-like protein